MGSFWYQLLREDGTSMGYITKVRLSPNADVDDFRKEVKAENTHRITVDPGELTVYLNKAAFDNKESHLKASAPVSGGDSEDNALVVVVLGQSHGSFSG